MSTTFNTILNDMKTSLRQAYGSALSYFLANLGLLIVVSLIGVFIAIPVFVVSIIALSPLTEASWDIMYAFAMANPLFMGTLVVLILIPIVALFMTVTGSIYGMTYSLVTKGETKAETAFSYLKRKFFSFMGTGILLTIIVLLPPVIVWGAASYANGYIITTAMSVPLTIFTFVWVFLTSGLTATVFPAVVNGKPVLDAFKESYSLATKYFDRIFGLLTAIVLLLAATFGPVVVAGLAMVYTTIPPITVISPLIPALAGIALWTVVSVFLWLFLFLPMVRIAWTRVYQELTGGTIASQIPVEVPLV